MISVARGGWRVYPAPVTDPSASPTPAGALQSPSTARNTAPILEVLRAHLPARGRVLEVASGAGEHAAAFTRALPGLDWTPSDPSPEARTSIAAWSKGSERVRAPLALDMLSAETWPNEIHDALICINMIHISPWAATEGLMALGERVLRRPGGLLVLYGPYLEPEVETTASNLAFDESLKRRDPAWGLREREAVVGAAKARGLAMTRRVAMPANNLMLLFRRL